MAGVLIDNGASLNAASKKGFTPLHLAAKYGNIKVAKLLLQKEAPVDAQGKNGVTPLHVASHYDHQNVALLLLDKVSRVKSVRVEYNSTFFLIFLGCFTTCNGKKWSYSASYSSSQKSNGHCQYSSRIWGQT